MMAQCCVSADQEGREARGFSYCHDCLLIPFGMSVIQNLFLVFVHKEAITLECSVKAPWLPVGWGMLRIAPDNTWYYTACGVSICVRNLDFARWKIGPWGHNGRPSPYLVLLLIELIRYPAAISCCYFCFYNIIKLKQSLGVGCFVFWEQGFYKHVMSVEVCARIPFSWLLFYLVTLLIKYWEDYIVFHRQM